MVRLPPDVVYGQRACQQGYTITVIRPYPNGALMLTSGSISRVVIRLQHNQSQIKDPLATS